MAITFSVSRFHPWISLGLLLGSSVGLSQEWIVKFRAPSYAKAVPALKNMGDFSFKATHPTGRLALIDIDPSAVNKDSVIDRLLHRSDVEYMVPNIRVHAFEDFEGDTQRSKQWALLKVQAQEAWKLQAGSRKVTVAVIDTGVDWKHGDLKDRIWSNNKEAPNGVDDDKNGYIDDIRGWNFFGKNNNPMDETSDKNPGHGTHCAGIIGAEGQGSGTIGIAPNISIMPIRFLGADGSGDLYSAALAIDYATQNGADVISASWGAAVERSQMQPVLEAIERASTKGIVFVAAAANDGKSNDTREVYPANAGFPNMISVAASDSQDQKPKWSNYGAATVDLASPGADILSTLPGNKFGSLSGTSMATPLVAGMVALLISQAKVQGDTFHVEDYKAILQASGDVVQIETACNCRVNAFQALSNVRHHKLTVVPNAGTVKEKASMTFHAIGGKAPYQFASSKPDVATVDASTGALEAKEEGEVLVTVTDANGDHVDSRTIHVGGSEDRTPPPSGDCPLGDAEICAIMCMIQPTLPWCPKEKEETLAFAF